MDWEYILLSDSSFRTCSTLSAVLTCGLSVQSILIQRENPGVYAVTRNLRFLVARQM